MGEGPERGRVKIGLCSLVLFLYTCMQCVHTCVIKVILPIHVMMFCIT